MRENMIERVARAICIARGIDPDHIGELPNDDGMPILAHAFPQWSLHKKDALAAIEAMREPTTKMIKAGNDFTENQSPEVFYQAMIDAALSTK